MLVPETVERVELNSRPYKVCSTETHCTSATVIIATGMLLRQAATTSCNGASQI